MSRVKQKFQWKFTCFRNHISEGNISPNKVVDIQEANLTITDYWTKFSRKWKFDETKMSSLSFVHLFKQACTYLSLSVKCEEIPVNPPIQTEWNKLFCIYWLLFFAGSWFIKPQGDEEFGEFECITNLRHKLNDSLYEKQQARLQDKIQVWWIVMMYHVLRYRKSFRWSN